MTDARPDAAGETSTTSDPDDGTTTETGGGTTEDDETTEGTTTDETGQCHPTHSSQAISTKVRVSSS